MTTFNKALYALALAHNAIKQVSFISECTVDNDNDGGEIIFTIDGKDYMLSLSELKD